MRYIFDKVASRMAVISITLDGGARTEGARYSAGLAHMMEHMSFKGTKNRNWQDINRQIAFIGGMTNAFTSQEMVHYYIYVPVENLETAMEILADQLFNSILPEEEFRKEWEVVKQEEVGRTDDPTEALFTELAARTMPGRLAIPIIGTKESIEAFSHEELVRYHEEIYQPSNMLVALAANCSEEEAARLMEKHFRKNDGFALSAETYSQKLYTSETVVVIKEGLEHTYACMCVPTFDMFDNRDKALEIADNILGTGMDSRLFEEVRERRGLVYNISSFNSSHRETGNFVIYFQTEEAKVDDVIDVINQELIKFAEDGITDEELARTKNSIRAGVYSTQDSTIGISQDSMERAYYNLESLDDAFERSNQITTEDVQSLAQELFIGTERLVVISKDS